MNHRNPKRQELINKLGTWVSGYIAQQIKRLESENTELKEQKLRLHLRNVELEKQLRLLTSRPVL